MYDDGRVTVEQASKALMQIGKAFEMVMKNNPVLKAQWNARLTAIEAREAHERRYWWYYRLKYWLCPQARVRTTIAPPACS